MQQYLLLRDTEFPMAILWDPFKRALETLEPRTVLACRPRAKGGSFQPTTLVQTTGSEPSPLEDTSRGLGGLESVEVGFMGSCLSPSVCLPAWLAGWLPGWLAAWLAGCLAVCLCLSVSLCVCVSVSLCLSVSVSGSLCVSVCHSVCVCVIEQGCLVYVPAKSDTLTPKLTTPSKEGANPCVCVCACSCACVLCVCVRVVCVCVCVFFCACFFFAGLGFCL